MTTEHSGMTGGSPGSEPPEMLRTAESSGSEPSTSSSMNADDVAGMATEPAEARGLITTDDPEAHRAQMEVFHKVLDRHEEAIRLLRAKLNVLELAVESGDGEG